MTSAENPEEGIRTMAKEISDNLNAGKSVLWLVCGGSNIPLSVEAMNIVKTSVQATNLRRLHMALTDERYGSVGHKDSNWKQLQDAGFDFPEESIPVLVGKEMKETVEEYEEKIKKAIEAADIVIAQFGIGPDGHIAGALPFSEAVTSENMVCGYVSNPFIRITLTPKALRLVHSAYVFAFGSIKKQALGRLKDENLSVEEEPAQILKEIPKVFIYTDYESA